MCLVGKSTQHSNDAQRFIAFEHQVFGALQSAARNIAVGRFPECALERPAKVRRASARNDA
jgi:hypothetical protein